MIATTTLIGFIFYIAVLFVQTMVFLRPARTDNVGRRVAHACSGVENAFWAHEYALQLTPIATVVVCATSVRIRILSVGFAETEVGRVQISAREGGLRWILAASCGWIEHSSRGAAMEAAEDFTFAYVEQFAASMFIRVLAVSSPLAAGTPPAVLSWYAVRSLAGSRQGRENGRLVAGTYDIERSYL